MLAGVNTAANSEFAMPEGCGISPEIQAKRDEILRSITQRTVEMTGGHMMHLFKGEAASILQSPNSTETSSKYSEGLARDIANGAGIAYEVATGDFQGMSYSAGQLATGIFDNSISIARELKVYKQVRLWYRSWLDEAMLKGTVPLLGGQEYWPNREAYAGVTCSGSQPTTADPLKNARTNMVELGNGTTSRTKITNEAGHDLNQIVTERAAEATLYLDAMTAVAEKHGLTLSDDAKLKIIGDIINTAAVTIPDAPAEADGNAP
jgi:capsid protein